jgi:hypothetical protein
MNHPRLLLGTSLFTLLLALGCASDDGGLTGSSSANDADTESGTETISMEGS